MVWAKRTMASEIILDDVGHLESRFRPFRDSFSVAAR
jgi:hypothetical protein